MAKVLNTYRSYTASDINTRCSATCSHSVVGSTVECTNVSLSAVRNVIGESTYSLYNICRSANVNSYSCFGPKIITYHSSGSESAYVTFDNPTSCSLGSFAGYNHSAVTPGWIRCDDGIWVNQGSSGTITGSVRIGELNYPNSQSFVVASYNGASYVDSQFIALDQYVSDSVDFTVGTGTISGTTTFTLKPFISQGTSGYSSGVDNLCRVPNASNGSCTVYMRTSSSGSYGGMSPFTLSGSHYSTSPSCLIGFSDCYDNGNSYSNIDVYAYLTTDGYGSHNPILLYSGAYTAGQHLGTLTGDFSVAGGAYGYHLALAVDITP
jgi:hypothetical protein